MADAGKARPDVQPAFVLHSYPFRETSLVIEVFTQDFGRVALVARGARRPRSALRGVLLAFQPLLLSWAGKSELRTLHKAEWRGGLPQLKGTALLCGFYLNELMLKLLPRDDPHEQLYQTYHRTLHALCNGSAHAVTLRRFEQQMLKELGYALPLERDVASGEAIQADAAYQFVIGRGPVRSACGTGSIRGTERILGESTPGYWSAGVAVENQLELAGQTLLDMARDDYANPLTMQQSKALMRMLINHYLGSQVLNTRQLMKDMQQL
ncbi:MAG TPA: DNA repair protein RecO [Burkholderiales bacterium]|jgi:DNA repair protein RecO (recombination protein O)|nr:DNA repair protein RecO [Burkholderiales bacterium]